MAITRSSARLLALLAGSALVAPASAQVDVPVVPAPGAVVVDRGPGPLGADPTLAGGSPFGDTSPRLPRVDYGSSDILAPIARRPDQLRGTTVMERPRPDYDAIGVRTGSFVIYPELSARVGYDSNVFSQNSGSGDVYGRLRAATSIGSDWSRHALDLDGFVDQRAYGKFQTEDGTTYSVRGTGRLDVGRTSFLTAGAQRARIFIERGAVTEILNTRRPIRYDLTSGNVAGHAEAGRLQFDLAGLVSGYDYKDAETPARVPLSQDFRDFTLYQARGEVGYGAGFGPTLFVSVTGELRRFRTDILGFTRDSDAIEVLGGIRSEITPLLRGRVGVGYAYSDFKDPTIRSRGGLSFDVALSYLVTDLTTLSVSARRSFKNVSSTTIPAAFAADFGVGVDHELLRNLIVSASGSYEDADYVSSPRRVKRYGAQLGALYLINRQFRLDGNVGYRKRNESGIVGQRDFNEIGASIGLTYRM